MWVGAKDGGGWRTHVDIVGEVGSQKDGVKGRGRDNDQQLYADDCFEGYIVEKVDGHSKWSVSSITQCWAQAFEEIV